MPDQKPPCPIWNMESRDHTYDDLLFCSKEQLADIIVLVSDYNRKCIDDKIKMSDKINKIIENPAEPTATLGDLS